MIDIVIQLRDGRGWLGNKNEWKRREETPNKNVELSKLLIYSIGFEMESNTENGMS